jgi:hypothetical protein
MEPAEPRQRRPRRTQARGAACWARYQSRACAAQRGDAGIGSDVDVYAFGPDAAPLVCEVKARKSGEGFAMLERWLGDADALFLRRDRAEPVVVLPWRIWARMVERLRPK